MKIIFVDKNKSLVNKVAKALKYFPKPVGFKYGDIFKASGVVVSASNPSFSMGGGLDALIARNYPAECSKVDRTKGNQRIGNVIFTITVNDNIVASQELVKSALDFALKNTKKSETVLISGLGTGIGGLDEDDFVWLFLASLSEFYGFGWGIKYVQKNSTDFRTGAVKYQSGKWLSQRGAEKDGKDCGVGLHLGKSFVGAGNYCIPEKIYFCIFRKVDKCGEGNDKIRVRRLLPVCELLRWLGYGKNGKKVLAKIDKKINPEDYNPYQATKLPSFKRVSNLLVSKVGDQIRDQVGAQVWDQVWDQVRAQVWAQVGAQVGAQVWDQVRDQVGAQVRDQVGAQVGDQVWDQVGAQVGDQVWDQVRDQVWAQVRDQVGAQVRDQVGAQVGDQVWATSYWAINIHFELGISHWFGEFLKLGVMPIFINGKIKIFGKKGKFLGEYDMVEFAKLAKQCSKVTKSLGET